MSGVPGVSIPDINALQVSEFVPDVTLPSLQRFGLNLTTDTLTLYFSEAVDVSTLDSTQITLHSMQNSSSVTLFGGFSPSLDGPIVQIIIPTPELNIIKLNEDFATSAQNIFLSLTSATIMDTDGNDVIPIDAVDPQPIDPMLFYPDFTSQNCYHLLLTQTLEFSLFSLMKLFEFLL